MFHDLKENSSVSQEVQSTTRIKIEVPVLKSSPKETAKKKTTEIADVFTIYKEHAEADISKCLCTKRREALKQ